MRLVACLHMDFDMEIQHSQLKMNHPSDTPSTKAAGGGIFSGVFTTSVNQKNDLLKLISVEKFLLDLALNKLYLSYATWFLIQFICTRYLLIQFVTNYVIF